MPEIFDISIDGQAFGFLGNIQLISSRFPFFLVKYQYVSQAFAAQYLFSFGDLRLVNSLGKNNKINKWKDI